MLRPTRLGGILSVDRDAMTVTALAGTRLEALEILGRGARRLRGADGEPPPRRHLLVPAHRPGAHQEQRPPRHLRDRAALPLRRWWDDRFLSNSLFGALNHLPNAVPRDHPRFNRLSSRMLSAHSYSDVAHRVFTSPREVVLREREYAVPGEAGLTALRAARRRSTRLT